MAIYRRRRRYIVVNGYISSSTAVYRRRQQYIVVYGGISSSTTIYCRRRQYTVVDGGISSSTATYLRRRQYMVVDSNRLRRYIVVDDDMLSSTAIYRRRRRYIAAVRKLLSVVPVSAGRTAFFQRWFVLERRRRTTTNDGTCLTVRSTPSGSRTWTRCSTTTRNCVSAAERSSNSPKYASIILNPFLPRVQNGDID